MDVDLNISTTDEDMVDTLPDTSTPVVPAINTLPVSSTPVLVTETVKVRIIRQLIRKTIDDFQGLHMVKYNTTDTEDRCTCNCKAFILNALICSHSLAILGINNHYPLSNLSATLCKPRAVGRPKKTLALEL